MDGEKRKGRSSLECGIHCRYRASCKGFTFAPPFCRYFLTPPSSFVHKPSCTTYQVGAVGSFVGVELGGGGGGEVEGRVGREEVVWGRGGGFVWRGLLGLSWGKKEVVGVKLGRGLLAGWFFVGDLC